MPRHPASSALRGLLLVCCLVALQQGEAQAQVQASEKAILSQMISGTEIAMEYYRPSARGRSPIFGGIVPWGEVWTPGANWATKLRLSKEVALNGVTVPAGTYGLWIELLEDAPWTLVVHADTARFHTEHPTVDDGLYQIPLHPTETPDFTETLTFTIDRVRLSSAELRLTWGNTRVPIQLGVDSGIEVTVAPEEFERFAGDWLYDDTPGLPTDEQIAGWREDTPEAGLEDFDAYYEGLFAMERPRLIHFEQDPATGAVRLIDPVADAFFAEAESGGTVTTAWGTILLPRGEGAYVLATTIEGELAEYDPAYAPLIEFEFGPDGRAVRMTQRGTDDEVSGTATRSGGATGG